MSMLKNSTAGGIKLLEIGDLKSTSSIEIALQEPIFVKTFLNFKIDLLRLVSV